MKSNWKKVRLGDFAEINPNISLKKDKIYSFIPMEDVFSDKKRYVIPSKQKRYSGGGAKFEEGDILFARITPCLQNGKISQVKNLKSKYGFGSTEFIVLRNRIDISDPGFLYYLSISDVVKNSAERSMSGATGRQRAEHKVIKNIEVKIPKLQNQRKIASILSAYDDLIKINNQRIKILEEMAQRIYEEWFVKFHFPGHEKAKIKNGIPERWERKKLKEFVDFERGVEPGSKNYLDKKSKGRIPFLRVGDLGSRDSGIFIKEKLAKNKILNKNDIAISIDGTVGTVRMGLEGAYSTGIRKVVEKENILGKAFVYNLVKSENIQNTIKAHAQGVTILHASKSIDYMEFVFPPVDILSKFNKTTGSVLDLRLNMEEVNNNLRKTRDLLLPKLMSGEIK